MEEKSYLQERIYEGLGVPPEQCMMRLKVEGRNGIVSEVECPIFTEDKDGNIEIHIWDLNRWEIEYDIAQENIGQTQRQCDNFTGTKKWVLTRLAPKNMPEDGENKYRMPKGGGIFPFLPPALIEKYERREHIPMLVLTEGYIKAFCASLYGWDIVGLSSITHYADSRTKHIHPAIREIIDKCKVDTVVILYDGDCLNISTKALARQDDLAKRPLTFYNALRKTKDLLIEYDVAIYFAHVLSSELKGEPKGLDDLLNAPDYIDKRKEILEDLRNLQRAGSYFYRTNLKRNTQALQAYFNLNSADSFYAAWREVIGEREFIFRGSNYVWDSTKERLSMRIPKELKNFCRVGDYFFEWIRVPSIFGKSTEEDDCELQLVPRKKSTIIDDFGKDAISKIPKYKTFINFPDHIDYKPIVNNCYNIYSPIRYKPDPTTTDKRAWKYINMTLHHIFGEQYELGLDYMQNLYLRPKQLLPILCLVSKERGTGKTSFLNLLWEIYGKNCSICVSDDLLTNFNGYVSGKLLVCIDETCYGEKNQNITNKVKNWSTAKVVSMENKNQDKIAIENFAKYIFCSNDTKHFIGIQKDEIRFWVREVPPFTDEELAQYGCKRVGDILPIFQEEIPAFLSYLSERKFYTDYEQTQSRMFFSPEQIETDILRSIKETQRNPIEVDIEEFMHDYFMDYGVEEQMLSNADIRRIINTTSIQGVKDNNLKSIITDRLGVERLERAQRYFYYVKCINGGVIGQEKINQVGRVYLFKRKQFVSDEEWAQR